MQNELELVARYGANNYHPLPVVLTRGEGAYVWDEKGKRYLDCLSAYSALNHGHRHPKILAAMVDQLSRVTLTSRAFHHDQLGPFLKKLCELSGFDRALPMNSGAEAVETAIKAARKWGYQIKKVAADQAEIIVCQNNFHGRTTTVVSFSTEHQYRDGFGPFTPGFKVIPYGDATALKAAITPNTVAFLCEPIQGEAGILLPTEGYLTEARKICTENRVLFMLDEIQTGLGRTGRFFAFEHERDARPDVVVIGKALGGGVYPVSAMLSNAEVMSVFKPGDHGSTFGGNPLAARVARVALEVLESDRLVENSARMGTRLFEGLAKINSAHVAEIRGRGLLVGVEIKKSSGPARPYCERLMALGLLAKETHGQVIRLAPPLTITETECDWIVETLSKVL